MLLPLVPLPTFREQIGGTLRAAETLTTLQINVGLACNLACRHCHVQSSPLRTAAHENLTEETTGRLLDWLAAASDVTTVDLTGGSPEMNPNFRPLVEGVRKRGKRVMDRCNPTILQVRDAREKLVYDWVPDFLAEHKVHVVASLPCYLEENIRKQRGSNAYSDSIEGLRRLNAVGYGTTPELRLTLVYNPTGPSLPPPQGVLEADYRRELKARFDLHFSELWTITNMPIARWRDDLQRRGELENYERLLREAYNPATIDGLMCRRQIHVDSQGRVHDCDFNYALQLRTPGCEDRFLWDLDPTTLVGREIRTAQHCFGCTAGAGSSCTGSLTQ
ncbi:arsenosugar biosynthesis radical SAM (seleno)protein ArsS [Botrimarina hoheduenensis]|uniref:Molybdenum cofactor biosynthesis protein A n=1 Tax=Botrimarina hoheduenensis TaxID=2528000 RepID=A0A5C5VTZ6_9BACT|nr:arsenosugar biosynthesis radical SAM (seleno)protein ArsS [Botrimarina hoheduenensis]TWT41627.1 molybdenum cofactor biosynthesis protein A [Botrimarina hoheduenensis]